jgi:type I pantothenate kinase
VPAVCYVAAPLSKNAPMPYIEFDTHEWARLRADTPLTLDEDDLARLRGINEHLSLREVEQVYLPLSRLLSLYVEATQKLYDATASFLGHPAAKVPYVIGMAGSVAVGKSTTARVLRELLCRWPRHPKVDLLTTDGFLYPNAELERRGLLQRKGFPETYDQSALMAFVSDIKAGRAEVRGPVYSHLSYDIVPGEWVVVDRPDIVIIEGLNVLESGATPDGRVPNVFLSDYFDFTIFVDAEVESIRQWYVDRFLKLRDTAFQNPDSYFHNYAHLDDGEAHELAREIWSEINERNLIENILPTRARADLVLSKAANHDIQHVRLRKI